MTARHTKVLIIGSGPAVLYRRHLCRPRHARAGPDRRHATGWPADDHHRCGKLSGLMPIAVQGPWMMEQMLEAGPACRRTRSSTTIVTTSISSCARSALDRRRHRLDRRRADHRHRRQGQVARHRDRARASRASASRPAPPATASSIATRTSSWSAAATPPSRKRSISSNLRQDRDGRAPPRQFPRGKDPAGAAVRQAQNVKVVWDHEVVEYLGAIGEAADAGLGQRREAAQRRRPAQTRDMPTDGVFVAIGHAPAVELFKGKLRHEAERLSRGRRRIRRRPTCRAFSPQATSPTTSIARRLRLPAWVAWRPSKPKNTLQVICLSQLRPSRSRQQRAAGIARPPAWEQTNQRLPGGKHDAVPRHRDIWGMACHSTGTSCGFSTRRPRPASFTHAADKLHLSQSAISRQVSALEQDVGIKLFHRHARGLILTEQGEILYRTAHDVLMKLESVQASS